MNAKLELCKCVAPNEMQVDFDSYLLSRGMRVIKGQMNQNFDILSLAILKQPNARRIHY